MMLGFCSEGFRLFELVFFFKISHVIGRVLTFGFCGVHYIFT